VTQILIWREQSKVLSQVRLRKSNIGEVYFMNAHTDFPSIQVLGEHFFGEKEVLVLSPSVTKEKREPEVKTPLSFPVIILLVFFLERVMEVKV
jgi:hypothetical protein